MIDNDYRVERWIGDSLKRKKVYDELGKLPYDEFRNKLYEMCYEYGKSVDFDIRKLNNYAIELDVSYRVLCSYMRHYAMFVLKMNKDDWQRVKNGKYYDEKLNKKLSTSSRYRKLYEELGGGDYFEFKRKLNKFCYDYIEECRYDYDKVLAFCKKWDMLPANFISCVKVYAKGIFGLGEIVNLKIDAMLSDRYDELYLQKELRAANIISKLIDAEYEEEIIDILKRVENINNIYYSIPRYVSNNYSKWSKKEQEKLINSLERKIKLYNDYCEIQLLCCINEDNVVINEARGIIRDYVNSEISNQGRYCQIKEIKISDFIKQIEIVSINDLKLYKLYTQKIERYQNKIYAIIIDKVSRIIYSIKNGTNNREFTMDDYYEILQMDLDALLKLSRSFLKEEDLKILTRFVFKNREKQKENYNAKRYIRKL